MKFILSLDQGTTSSRALLVDRQGRIQGIAQKEFTQIYPKPGWVEHDPEEIWNSQLETIQQVFAETGAGWADIAAIGITNQRETTIVWDQKTGKPVYNAIVWQDKRTAPICEELKKKGEEVHVRKTTGLVIDSYFSATKIRWILDKAKGQGPKAKVTTQDLQRMRFGTVDSWLIWKLTGGKVHATDYTNASRTMLFNIETLAWDPHMLSVLDIPEFMLPKVYPSSHLYGHFSSPVGDIPICGVAGDQQSALFGQACFEPGMAKNTYGTGCFMLMNTGQKKFESQNGLITTLACSIDGSRQYALEGSVFIAGAALQWLRDGLHLISDSSESESLAKSVVDSDEVFVVPAFVGLGAPYWDMYARGAIFGLTRDTGIPHLVKATLESLAYQTKDVLEAMLQDSGLTLKALKVDGGAVVNNYLMQFQSDILNVPVERPEVVETTALGAAFLAGIQIGWWTLEEVSKAKAIERTFHPNMSQTKRTELYNRWKEAVKRTIGWLT